MVQPPSGSQQAPSGSPTAPTASAQVVATRMPSTHWVGALLEFPWRSATPMMFVPSVLPTSV